MFSLILHTYFFHLLAIKVYVTTKSKIRKITVDADETDTGDLRTQHDL